MHPDLAQYGPVLFPTRSKCAMGGIFCLTTLSTAAWRYRGEIRSRSTMPSRALALRWFRTKKTLDQRSLSSGRNMIVRQASMSSPMTGRAFSSVKTFTAGGYLCEL
jgi:hypothetical protein